MGKRVEVAMMERSDDLLDSEMEIEPIDSGMRELGVRETLLVNDQKPQASVGFLYLLSLTCGVGGLQVIWSVILSNGSPFLVSLGLSKSLTALVWVAAPLCGVIVQPLVGILSDRTRSRWGRRRPFIIGGAIGVIFAMLALAWVEQIFHGTMKALGRDLSENTARSSIILIATFWIYALNICIQPLQAGLRTLIVENCPTHQQAQASAWASSMTGIGNIVGYLAGFTTMPNVISKYLTQFQCLCLVASVALVVTITTSCSVKEQNSPHAFPVRLERTGCAVILRDLIHTYNYMPRRIRKVCHIQFLAWMGWFPFLFYSTTYVGEFYAGRTKATDLPTTSELTSTLNSRLTKTLSSTSDETKALCLESIRFGTFASFLFAIVAFLMNLTLPFLLRLFERTAARKSSSSVRGIPQLWTCAHILFAFTMFLTFFATSQAAATFIIASAGLSWALTLWAPFAIIGNELASRQSFNDMVDEIDGDEAASTFAEVQAGAIMGLHNVAISAPQIFAALVCSVIFWLAKLAGNPYGTGWVLRAGGVAASGAAYLTYRLGE